MGGLIRRHSRLDSAAQPQEAVGQDAAFEERVELALQTAPGGVATGPARDGKRDLCLHELLLCVLFCFLCG